MSENLAYLAGLFDGEGTFNIQVSVRSQARRDSVWFNPRMSMTLKYGTEVFGLLVEEFGGNTYTRAEGTTQWALGKRADLQKAATKLLPYLRIKKTICSEFLRALELYPERAGHGAGERSWTKQTSLEVLAIARNLNPPSARWKRDWDGLIDQVHRTYAANRGVR